MFRLFAEEGAELIGMLAAESVPTALRSKLGNRLLPALEARGNCFPACLEFLFHLKSPERSTKRRYS